MLYEIGPHRVRHGDMMDGLDELIAGAPPFHWVYSDPPWGSGNLKYWQTVNAKMNGVAKGPAADCGDFLARFFATVSGCLIRGGVAFVEYGIGWREELLARAAAVGLREVCRATPKYRSGRVYLPLDLIAFTADPAREAPPGWADRVRGTFGFDTLVAATDGWGMAAGQRILDPCCGMGYTARLALRNGMAFYGNELNRKRLEKTVAVLRGGTA